MGEEKIAKNGSKCFRSSQFSTLTENQSKRIQSAMAYSSLMLKIAIYAQEQ